MFESAKRKLERAEQHVRDFDQMFTDFIDARPHRPIIRGDVENGKFERIWVEVQIDAPLPVELALILGDAVHNFRCVLDHLMWELMGIDGGKQDRHTKFPVGRSRQDFEAAARGAMTPCQTSKQFLVDLEAYPTGEGELFYGVHALDNADKHTVITPVAHVSYVEGITLTDLATGKRTEAHPVYAGPVSGGSTIAYEAPAGFGIDAMHPIDPTPDVFFPEVDIFPHEPVVQTLARVSFKIEHLVREFEHFATGRMINGK